MIGKIAERADLIKKELDIRPKCPAQIESDRGGGFPS
jgi:hypothetical protein